VGLEVTAKGIRADIHSQSWGERIPDGRSCNTETVNKWDGKHTGI